MRHRQTPASPGPHSTFAVILGTNEIASAVALALHRRGCAAVLSHDPLPPVIRRGMAFHDALFGDPVSLNGVVAQRVDTGLELLGALSEAPAILITPLGLLDLIVVRPLDILIDARMQKYEVTPDLRRLAKLTIGLGPGFSAGSNCDSAIETQPAQAGQLILEGSSQKADGVARKLGRHGAERFVYATSAGRWHTAIEIGTRVFKDFAMGHLGEALIRAPFDGVVRGIARDGTEVPSGVKLLEIDGRGRRANWTGLDKRGRTIASAVIKAIVHHEVRSDRLLRRASQLVH